LKACLHAEHPRLKPSVKKIKVEETEPKVTPKILMPPRGQQNLARGMNLKGKPYEAQVELL
jgi:hypothetical protein